MSNKNQIWTIVGISLVVALIVSALSVGITANVISVAKGTAGKVYTTQEVDAKISKLNSELRYGKESITYDMLVRLDKCTVIKDKQSNGVISCDSICGNNKMICVDADYLGTLRPCSDSAGSINTERFCKCCGL